MIDQRTHWDDCWRERSHHDCAVARIESLLKELASQSVPINMDEFRPMTPSEHAKVNNALRARIAELERENDALSMEASENLRRREKAESDFKELSISSNARVAEGLLARSAVALAAERERREADETDAARYRWLREWRARWEIRYWNGIYWNQLITDELGAAIDAAIAAERGGK